MDRTTILGFEMDKETHHKIVFIDRPLPLSEISTNRLQGNTGLACHLTRLGQPCFRLIHRGDLQPLSGQPDAVAPFPLADQQDCLIRLKTGLLGDQKRVRFRTVGKPCFGITGFPE